MKPALSAAVSLLALIAGAAHAEPNITGMWALDEPAEWKAATRNAPVLPEVMARQQAIQKRDTANHRIIGQLHGGAASCVNIDYDSYGAVWASWDQGTANLKTYLDPTNSDIRLVDGIDLNVARAKNAHLN